MAAARRNQAGQEVQVETQPVCSVNHEKEESGSVDPGHAVGKSATVFMPADAMSVVAEGLLLEARVMRLLSWR